MTELNNMEKIKKLVETQFNNTVINCTWVQDGQITVLPDVVRASKEFYIKQIATLIQESNDGLNKLLDERIKQHTDNLELWNNGTLTPTEPSWEERDCVKRELRACIDELNIIKAYLSSKETDNEKGGIE